MAIVAKREFLKAHDLDMVCYSTEINARGMAQMRFTLFIGSVDVTLHREFVTHGNPNYKLELDSATSKIRRMINTMNLYVEHLQSEDHAFEDHTPIGTMVEADTGEYHGESSTIHLWLNGDHSIFAITSCQKKIRTTTNREETAELLTSLIGHLEQHLSDAMALLNDYISKTLSE